MRFILSLFPISRREADHSAEKVREVLAELGWVELIKTTLVTFTMMVTMSTLVLLIPVSDQWA